MQYQIIMDQIDCDLTRSAYIICALAKPIVPRQHGRHHADDIFKCIFFNKSFCILIKMKFVAEGLIEIS